MRVRSVSGVGGSRSWCHDRAVDPTTLVVVAVLGVVCGAAGGALVARHTTQAALRAQRADAVRRSALQVVADQRLRVLRSAQHSTEQAGLTGPAVRLRFAEGVLADVEDLPGWQAARTRNLVRELVGREWAEAAATLGTAPPGTDSLRSHFEIQLYLRNGEERSDGDAGLLGRLHDASAVESEEVARRGTYVEEAVRVLDELARTLRADGRWRLGRRRTRP
jgi:hypothetical protein